jgi:hypothetical protein
VTTPTNYYKIPFTFRHGAHLITAVPLRLARHVSEDDPLPPAPDPDVPPPPPEPEPVPVPEPEPPVPAPDDPVPPPPPDDWAVDEHTYPGFLVLYVGTDPKGIRSHKGRRYQIVTGAVLSGWGLSSTNFDRHLDATLAHHATWRTPHYVFLVDAKHERYDELRDYLIARDGLMITP